MRTMLKSTERFNEFTEPFYRSLAGIDYITEILKTDLTTSSTKKGLKN